MVPKYAQEFDVKVGLSDHTIGNVVPILSMAMGAKVIEKHFTDDISRDGPDHKFSMDPKTWKDMVDRTRELEFALGSETKKVEDNEKETVVLQRRALRVKRSINSGEKVSRDDIESLRPCPVDGIEPYNIDKVLGKSLNTNIEAGDCIRWKNLK